jgi:hypothetical protein
MNNAARRYYGEFFILSITWVNYRALYPFHTGKNKKRRPIWPPCAWMVVISGLT